MAVCRIAHVDVLDNNARLGEYLKFEVTLDLAEPLSQDLLFRCLYISDPGAVHSDIELDCIDVGDGGVPRGVLKFVFDVPPPSQSMILSGGGPQDVAGLYLCAQYRGEEFTRVGYYVRYEYEDPAMQEEPPAVPDWGLLRRVLSDPCVTRFPVRWDGLPPPSFCVPVSMTGWGQPASEPAAVAAPPEIVGRYYGEKPAPRSRSRSRSPRQAEPDASEAR